MPALPLLEQGIDSCITKVLFWHNSSILSSTNESHEKTLLDGISALMIFCKSEELQAQGRAFTDSFICQYSLLFIYYSLSIILNTN